MCCCDRPGEIIPKSGNSIPSKNRKSNFPLKSGKSIYSNKQQFKFCWMSKALRWLRLWSTCTQETSCTWTSSPTTSCSQRLFNYCNDRVVSNIIWFHLILKAEEKILHVKLIDFGLAREIHPQTISRSLADKTSSQAERNCNPQMSKSNNSVHAIWA